MRPSFYARLFAVLLDEAGITDVDPSHIEAWVRLQHTTLNHLTRDELRDLALSAARIARRYPAESARLAASV